MQQGRPAHAPKAASPCTEGCNPIHQSLHPPAYQSLRACALQVRSSSLFEDAFLQPFAGIYRTVIMPSNPHPHTHLHPKPDPNPNPNPNPNPDPDSDPSPDPNQVMMPNNSPSLDERVDELGWAVRMVYASTFSQQARQCLEGTTSSCHTPLLPPLTFRYYIPLQARQYLESTNNRMEEEKMAVIMQAHAMHMPCTCTCPCACTCPCHAYAMHMHMHMPMCMHMSMPCICHAHDMHMTCT